MGILKMDIKAIAILLVCVYSAFCSPLKTGDETFPCTKTFGSGCDETNLECKGTADCSNPKNPTDDVNPKQDELAILVTGGRYTETSSEVLFTNGSSICEIPPLTNERHHHTQSGLTACGGNGRGTLRGCIKFEAGSWINLTDDLTIQREEHSSWMMADGGILLMGGVISKSTEIVYQNGTSIRSFDLKYDAESACSIELPEMFILTGGFDTLTTVSRYTTDGWIEDLPELNVGRRGHGCGYFYNDDMQRVFLVAGGTDSGRDPTNSTETLVEGEKTWNFQQILPSSRYGLRGISLPDSVIMIGGYDYDVEKLDELVMYDAKSSVWKKIGSMKKARVYHAASLVNMGDVIDFCI